MMSLGIAICALILIAGLLNWKEFLPDRWLPPVLVVLAFGGIALLTLTAFRNSNGEITILGWVIAIGIVAAGAYTYWDSWRTSHTLDDYESHKQESHKH
jgi:hypothetical protein